MIEIYTDPKLAPNDKLVMSVDNAFLIDVKLNMLDEQCRQMMYDIDRAKLVDKSLGSICTPLGITGIESLSSGCRAAILVYLAGQKKLNYSCVNITECGTNALKHIFKIANIPLLLYHAELLGIGDWEGTINGTHFHGDKQMVGLMIQSLWGN